MPAAEATTGLQAGLGVPDAPRRVRRFADFNADVVVDHPGLRLPSAAMSDWTITPILDESDIDSIVALDRLSFSMPWPREMFLRAFDDPTDLRIALSRFHNSQSCAGFVCYTTKPGQVEIASLAVALEARRSGLASALVGYALAEARRGGATVASLHVRVSNKAARRFYERCGFTQCRVRHDYYANPLEDALIYSLRLDH